MKSSSYQIALSGYREVEQEHHLFKKYVLISKNVRIRWEKK